VLARAKICCTPTYFVSRLGAGGLLIACNSASFNPYRVPTIEPALRPYGSEGVAASTQIMAVNERVLARNHAQHVFCALVAEVVGRLGGAPTLRARLDKHRWLRDRHLAAATPTWKQSSATEHSMVARDDGTVNTDSGVNSERS
jgi:hypothetical protein